MDYSRRGLQKQRSKLRSRSLKRLHKINNTVAIGLLLSVFGVAATGMALGFGAFKGVIDTAPDISNINVTPTGYSTFVYDTNGKQTAKLVSTDSNRIPVTLDQVPLDMQHAFVAIEDERFYDHRGIDIQGIIRAGMLGIQARDFSQGASTITQQLLKNNVFDGWMNETFMDSVRRKVQEQYLAIELEQQMSKDDIMINYLNTINLGHNTLGVQAASLRYFGKDVSKLNLSECAVIAGITQNPSKFDPIEYPEKNKGRRQAVLDKMLDQGWIDQEQYDKAVSDNVYARIRSVDLETNDNQVNSYFVDALTDQVLADLQTAGYNEQQAFTLLFSGGLQIHSTQDPEIQAIVDEEVNNESHYPYGTKWYLDYRFTEQLPDGSVQNYSKEMMELWLKTNHVRNSLIFPTVEAAQEAAEQYKNAMLEQDGGSVIAEDANITPQPQISITIEDQHTGSVVAMNGGRGEKKANRTLNRATGTLRQPGSTFKVVSTYAPALDAAGMSLATTQEDAPYNYADGTKVRNWYGDKYRGTQTIRQGIQSSLNIVTVKTLVEITPQLGFEYLKDFGFTTLVADESIGDMIFTDIQPTLALGGLTRGVKNIELNGAYSAIANGGEYLEPKLYTTITDHDGNIVLDATDRETRRVLKPTTAWLLTSAMEDVVTKGTGTMVNFGTTPIAGKTGTTSDENDVWFAGYTNYYCATTWAGYDENTDLVGVESNIAKIIWRACMERIHEGKEASDFEMPKGIVRSTVCAKSGKIPVDGCPRSTEYFDKDTLPTEFCDIHQSTMICSIDGLPASDTCPFKQAGKPQYRIANLKCHHSAKWMTQPDVDDAIADEKGRAKEIRAEVVAYLKQQYNLDGMLIKDEEEPTEAEKALNAANGNLNGAAGALLDAQNAFTAAQASGDQAAIEAALQAVNAQTAAYNSAVQAQAAAQAAADAEAVAKANEEAAANGDANAAAQVSQDQAAAQQAADLAAQAAQQAALAQAVAAMTPEQQAQYQQQLAAQQAAAAAQAAAQQQQPAAP